MDPGVALVHDAHVQEVGRPVRIARELSPAEAWLHSCRPVQGLTPIARQWSRHSYVTVTPIQVTVRSAGLSR